MAKENWNREGMTWYPKTHAGTLEKIYIDHFVPSKGWRAVFVNKYSWDTWERYFKTKSQAVKFVLEYIGDLK